MPCLVAVLIYHTNYSCCVSSNLSQNITVFWRQVVNQQSCSNELFEYGLKLLGWGVVAPFTCNVICKRFRMRSFAATWCRYRIVLWTYLLISHCWKRAQHDLDSHGRRGDTAAHSGCWESAGEVSWHWLRSQWTLPTIRSIMVIRVC